MRTPLAVATATPLLIAMGAADTLDTPVRFPTPELPDTPDTPAPIGNGPLITGPGLLITFGGGTSTVVIVSCGSSTKGWVASANNPWSPYRYKVRWAMNKGSPLLLAYCSFQMRRSWGS